ncbi:MAG: thiamine pyrophosphate-dependent enzyme, partial [Bacteroidales bacterium]
PLYVGFMGMHGNIASNVMIQEADLIIAAGMRFSDRVTGHLPSFAPKAKIIHIDIDRSEFDKTVKSDLHLHGDAATILSAITPERELPKRGEWLLFMEEKKLLERELVIDPLFNQKGSNRITMAQLVDKVTSISKGDQVIVTDVGQHQMFCARYSKFSRGRSLISSGGLGTMGFGLPAAVGAKVGVPHRRVVAILGDGGFQMTLQELGTIVQSGIDLKIVVVNNSYLGMVRQWQELFFEKRYSHTEIVNPNFPLLAKAYGIESAQISQIGELDSAIETMFNHRGAYLLEVVVEREENVFPMVPLGSSIEKMIYN